MKTLPLLLMLSACAGAPIVPTYATQVVTFDGGGRLDQFIEKFHTMRQTGEKEVIDGVCMSACTLALALLPAEQVCATSHAIFGFHSAAAVAEDGTSVFSSLGTQIMWAMYPAPVQAVLKAHGWDGPWEHPTILLVSGDEMFSMIRMCDESDKT